MGGGTRTFTGFDSRTGTYAFQQLDQTKLTRTSPNSYEMLSRDGARKVFNKSDGSTGTSRKIFLTQLIDPYGNAVSLGYDPDPKKLRVMTITDAIGQVTTISYGHPTDIYKITRVTDPFRRSATFDYDAFNRLTKITDVSGITSQFTYDAGDFITTLTTPYGVTSFAKSGTDNPFGPPSEPFGDTHRSLETIYPDGTRDRVEFNQNQDITGVFDGPADSAAGGMRTINEFLSYRNTFYWSRQAAALAYGDYSKAKLYHWLHSENMVSSASILESVEEPLESRIWYDYAGQSNSTSSSQFVGSSSQPEHIGRVLDDGSTQLYSYEYNGFGNVTKTTDPVGRTFSYTYADNGIDLLEIRQTRADQNELRVIAPS
jgi:YD repeat-containing protein